MFFHCDKFSGRPGLTELFFFSSKSVLVIYSKFSKQEVESSFLTYDEVQISALYSPEGHMA